MAEVYVAVQSAVVEHDGRPVPVRRGATRVEEGHELLRRYPHLFAPAAEGAHYRVARSEPRVTPTRAPRRKRGAKGAEKAAPAPQEKTTAPEGTEGTPEAGETQQEGAPSPESASGEQTGPPTEQVEGEAPDEADEQDAEDEDDEESGGVDDEQGEDTQPPAPESGD